VLDLVKYAGNQYNFTYNRGWPWFSNPTNQKGSLGNPAWDWLNLYLYDFNFHPKKINGKEIRFTIVLQSDTGYFDSIFKEETSIDKINPNEFSDSSKSETRLIFLVGINVPHSWNYDQLFSKDFASGEFDLSSNKTEWKLANTDKPVIAKAYNLENFINQSETDKYLNDFLDYCKRNDLPIKEDEQLINPTK